MYILEEWILSKYKSSYVYPYELKLFCYVAYNLEVIQNLRYKYKV